MTEAEIKKNVATTSTTSECRVYIFRWIVLFLYFMFAITAALQWVQYSIIADILAQYYKVSYMIVNWTAMTFYVIYIPFSVPGTYLIEKLGLRGAVLIAAAGTCVGTWIKVASAAPDRFWVLLLGQSVVAIFQVFYVPIPPVLAAVWFGANEVSTACSIAMTGIQVGIGLGFIVPSFWFENQANSDVIGHNLYIMALGVAIISTIMLFVLVVAFKAKPPTPPSPAQLQLAKREDNLNFTGSLKELMCNSSFILLLTAYTINAGISNALSTLLNHIILRHYPDGLEDAGAIGLVALVAGIVGCLVGGIVQDKFGRFKETTMIMYGVNLLAMVAFTLFLGKPIIIIYVISAVLGFTWIGIQTTGFELAAELTYPVSENIAAGLLMMGTQITAIVFTYLYSFLFDNEGDVWADIVMVAFLVFVFILTVCIKYDLKRRAVQTTEVTTTK